MHTEGKWEFAYYGDPLGPIVFSIDPTDETNGIDICEVMFANNSIKESLANARLICAAPDMYAVLSGLVDSPDDPFVFAELLKDAQQIITALKGEK